MTIQQSLTHAVDVVSDHVAFFTHAVETTWDILTYLVTSGRKFRIRTLINVCPVDKAHKNNNQQSVQSHQKI